MYLNGASVRILKIGRCDLKDEHMKIIACILLHSSAFRFGLVKDTGTMLSLYKLFTYRYLILHECRCQAERNKKKVHPVHTVRKAVKF